MVVAGYDVTEDISPSECLSHYEEFKGEGGYYRVRVNPKSFWYTEYPDACHLSFTAVKPWTNILFSFWYCESDHASCLDETTMYSYIKDERVTVSIINEESGNMVCLISLSSMSEMQYNFHHCKLVCYSILQIEGHSLVV